jgi:hypothetical protein
VNRPYVRGTAVLRRPQSAGQAPCPRSVVGRDDRTAPDGRQAAGVLRPRRRDRLRRSWLTLWDAVCNLGNHAYHDDGGRPVPLLHPEKGRTHQTDLGTGKLLPQARGQVIDELIDTVNVWAVVEAPLEEGGAAYPRRRPRLRWGRRLVLGTATALRMPERRTSSSLHRITRSTLAATERLEGPPVVSVDPVHGCPARQECGLSGPTSGALLSQERRRLTRLHNLPGPSDRRWWDRVVGFPSRHTCTPCRTRRRRCPPLQTPRSGSVQALILSRE